MDLISASKVILRTHLAALDHNTRANALMLEGGPGVGKSDTVFQTVEKLAQATNQPCGLVQFMLATISSVDVRGFMLPTKGPTGVDTVFSTPPWYPVRANTWVCEPGANGVVWHKPGTWQDDLPSIGVLFLDEFGQAEDEVKKPAAELMYKGAVGTAELPIGWRVIAAQNRVSDRSGVLRELMFLVNRRCRLSIDASLPAFLEWANKQPEHVRPHYMTLSFAQQNPDIVFQEKVPDGSDPFCTPRTLCLMDKDLKALRHSEVEHHKPAIQRHPEMAAEVADYNAALPMDDIAREVAAGWIGGGAAAQFFTHLKYGEEIPTIAEIEADPEKAKCPDKRDAQMVASYMLSHSVTEKNAKQVLKYMHRFNVEMQVLFIHTTCMTDTRAKYIVSEPLYMQWLGKHKETLMASRS